ncbi:hypothetical protein POM88_037395 [Heracleum sosnowskyi]|uniref:Uncharacterized protein n=1 Tax=Heracleum sosnowskyi TaxID=360622 RepID=A0AAD8HR09_9APIA|nr:hypothetical protein POM88_037395 [Heracleum sosnowskyi]
MRIIDPGIQKNNYSSIPSHSISRREVVNLWPFNQPITVIECPSPVISTRYINITSPNSSSFSASVLGKYYVYSYVYIVAGDLKISKIEYNCRISKQTWISRQSALEAKSRASSVIQAHTIFQFHAFSKTGMELWTKSNAERSEKTLVKL